MRIMQGLFSKFYGPRMFFDGAEGGGGGSGANNDQTNWKAQFEALQAQIAGGQYVTKDSYVTLQRNLEKAVNEKKAIEEARDTANAKAALKDDAVETLRKQMEALQTTNTQLDSANKEAGAKLERHNLIFKDFPHLAPFEADGLIPAPQGDQKLEDVLTRFSERVQSVSGKALEDFKKGSTPPPPPPSDQTPKGPAALKAEALALLGRGDTKGYDTKMDEYHKANAQAQSQ